MNKAIPFILFFLVFALYLFTLHPSVSPYRDSGDLIVASHTLGIAHPPGYPLYVLSGKLFSVAVPFGNAAYRANVMSAFSGALAIALLALCVSRLFPGLPYAPFLVLFLAFSPAFWRLSQVSEMYSLNAFFAALILYLALLVRDGRQKMPALYLLGLVSGLATANHQTILFMYPALLWFAAVTLKLKAKDLAFAALFFMLGWSIYVFLPLRAATGPVSNWGDTTSLEGFLRLITRADYGGMKLHPEQSTFAWTLPLIFKHLLVYGNSLVQQFTWIGLAAGCYGIVRARRERYFIFLLVSLIISGPAFVIFSNLPPAERTTLPILEPHLVLPNLLFAVFICAGLSPLLARFAGRAAAAALLVFAFASHAGLCAYRGDFFAYNYGRDLLSTVEKGAIVYDPDDATAFITSYLQNVEGKRRDVIPASFFRTRWGYERMKKLHPEILPVHEITSGRELARIILDFNRDKRPVYAELPGKFGDAAPSYPRGILNRLSAGGEFEPSAGPFVFYRQPDLFSGGRERDFFTGRIISYYASARSNIGLAYSRLGKNDLARDEYYRAIAADPALDAAYNNLGALAFAAGDHAGAEHWFRTVMRVSAENGSILFNLGLTLRARGNIAGAEAYLGKAWRDYGNTEAANELGLIALQKGDPRSAVRVFGSIIERNPEYNLAYYNLGLALQKAGNYTESRRYFTLYLQRTTDPAERREVQTVINALPR